MINNRDCFFYKKSDFINRLQDISPDSVCYIADTQQIYTHGRYFECNVTQDVVEQLIQNHGYLTAADLPVLTGGASPTPDEYVTGVSVGGHNINVQKGKLSEINVGTASKLETPRKIELSGDLSGSIMFDGSANISIPVTIANDSHTHITSASSNATTNLTITAGGTTATVANLYATYADQLRTARTISLTGDVTGSTSFNGTGNVSITATVADNSHNHTFANISDKPVSRAWQQNNNNNITTSQFLDLLEAAGAFTYGWFHTRGSWSYASTSNITDTGYGTIDLAGCAITVWGSSKNNCTILIIPPLNSSVSSSVELGTIYIYINNGDAYSSGWRKIARFEDIDWINITNKPSSFTPSSHTHPLSQISNLNGNWDSLLANAPSAYLTRWPSISEVTGKQNLVIRLNGGTTEGTNQFTYNGIAAKTLSITPGNIGAATSSHTHNMNNISDASSQLVTAGTVTRKVFLCKNKTGNGWVSRVALGLTNPTGQFSPAILSIGTNDGGTSWYDYTFTPDGHITNSRGEFALVSQIPSLSGYATQSWVQSQGYLTSVTWDNVKNKPSWIGSSKPSYSWSEISGKPSSFTPSSHSHAWLNGWGDTRSVAETPNSYNGRFEVVGIKNSSTYGISSGTYVQVLGFRGWTDSNGGRAHELAFADNGRIYHRDGATTSWDSWDTVAYLSDIQKNTTGTSNSTSKLYLVGGPTQNSAGVITYSNSAVYTQSGQVYATQMNSTNGFYETSDARLKDFKEDVKALDTVDQIPTKYFTWKEDENQESQIGTSAQEVEKLYPELVSKTEDDTLTVDYAKLSIIALAAIKELKVEIQSLKEEIKQLKSK